MAGQGHFCSIKERQDEIHLGMRTTLPYCLDRFVLQGASGVIKDPTRLVEHGMGGTNDCVKCYPVQGMNIGNDCHRTDTGTDLQPQ
ncbi:hypothetical protein [Arthrobacter sp. MDT3-44]